MEPTNKSLIFRVRDPSDEAAWREFTTLYRPIIVNYARARGVEPMDAEDVAQEVLRILVRRLKTFDYDREKGRFSNWLLTIVHNQIKQQYRKRKPKPADTAVLEGLASPESSRAVWEPIFVKEHIKLCLKLVRHEFNETSFEVFERTALKEESTERVCEALGITANQVHIARHRVLKRLKVLMVEHIGYEW